MLRPISSPGSNYGQPVGPKRYNQIDAKSADHGNLNLMGRPNNIPLYKKSNSVDENIYSPNTAFEVKTFSPTVNNGNFNNNQTNNLKYFQQDRFEKMLSNENIDLENFPVPPIPKEYQSSIQLFVPEKKKALIKKYTVEADDLVCKGEYDKAKALYLKIAHLDPYDGRIWMSLGKIYLLQNKIMECFNCFQGCIFYSENHQDGNFWYAVGELYSRMELYHFSITAFMAVFELDPDKQTQFKLHCKLGMVCCKIYELDKATEHFQKALLFDPNNKIQNTEILVKLGLIEEEKGDLTKAISKYVQALNLEENQRKVYAHLAWCYFKARNYDKCQEVLRMIDQTTGVNFDSEACSSLYIKARMYSENGNLTEAQKYLWKAIENDRENAAYW